MKTYKVSFVTVQGVPYTGVMVNADNMGQVIPALIEEGFQIRAITFLSKVESAS